MTRSARRERRSPTDARPPRSAVRDRCPRLRSVAGLQSFRPRPVWPLSAARPASGLSGCSGDVGGDDVGGVPVEAGPGPVVAHGGARVGVRGGFLHVAQRDPGVEGGGDERVPQGVRADLLGDPGAAGDPADDPGGAVPVQPPARRRRGTAARSVRSPMARSMARAVRGASGMVTTLPPLRVMTRVR